MGNDVLLLVGTSKGLFSLRPKSGGWQVEGPAFRGAVVDSAAIDTRSGPRLFAGTRSEHWGPALLHSDDLGKTWSEPAKGSLRFPEDTGAALVRVWQILPDRHDPEVVWAGVEPAALFRSDDRGVSFELNRGLWDHPHRASWEPGGGGLGLHSIVRDPDDPSRTWVAVSAAGVYCTEDGGSTWEARNLGIRADFRPGEDLEFGQCVHKIAQHPAMPERLYAQNHGGVYRSDDAGQKWTDIGAGLPSDFGFPLVVNPNDPDTAYVIPLDSDEFRCTAEGRCRVFRTSDAGATWEALGEGLPQESAYLAVLRDAFTTDGADPAGLYFGTRTGELFASRDGGETWSEAARHLPPVLSVRAAPV